jgi:hypothetical protein
MKYFVYEFDVSQGALHYAYKGVEFQHPVTEPRFRAINNTLVNRHFPSGHLPEEVDYFIVPALIKVHPGASPDGFKDILTALDFYEEFKSRHIFFVEGDASFLNGSVVFAPETTDPKQLVIPYNITLDPQHSYSPVDMAKTTLLMSPPDNKTLADCCYVLCDHSLEHFYNALAFGRIPVLVYDDIKLPLEQKIPYHEFVVRVQEKDKRSVVSHLGRLDLLPASKKARHWWTNYLSDGAFKRLLDESLAERTPNAY